MGIRESVANLPDPKPRDLAPAPAHRAANLAWEAAPVAGQLADAVTTAVALARGATESNPLMRPIAANPKVGVPIFVALKLGLGLGAAAAVRTLRESGHTTAAKVCSVAATVCGLGPAINNLAAIRKLGDRP